MEKDNPYIEMIQIVKECRANMLADTALATSPDLYDVLYGNVEKRIYETKLELYELVWLESHWTKIIKMTDEYERFALERSELISLLVKWYQEFIVNWNYSDFDIMFFEEKRNILKAIISMNDEWDNNLKRMKVSFIQSKKILQLRIKELESEV